MFKTLTNQIMSETFVANHEVTDSRKAIMNFFETKLSNIDSEINQLEDMRARTKKEYAEYLAKLLSIDYMFAMKPDSGEIIPYGGMLFVYRNNKFDPVME